MKRARTLVVIWLLFWLAIWFLQDSSFGLVLCIGTVIGIAVERMLLHYQKKAVQWKLTTDTTVQKQEILPVKVQIINHSWFSLAHMTMKLQGYNQLTGERMEELLSIQVPGKGSQELEWQLVCQHCGRIELQVTEVYLYDGWGIFAAAMDAGEQIAALVLPNILPVKINPEIHDSKDVESDEYSMYQAGEDVSEIFAFREYIPGDRLQNIHWKLSEKTDSVIVKQPSFPISNQLVILMDNSVAKDLEENKDAVKEREAMGEYVVSISAELCEMQIPHHIIWMDWNTGMLKQCFISQLNDLMENLADILSVGIEVSVASVTRQYIETAGTHTRMIVIGMREEAIFEINGEAISYVNVQNAKEGIGLAIE